VAYSAGGDGSGRVRTLVLSRPFDSILFENLIARIGEIPAWRKECLLERRYA
jgi:hypothetical protein